MSGHRGARARGPDGEQVVTLRFTPQVKGEFDLTASIEAVSWGKERPRASGHDEAAWARNRNAYSNIIVEAIS